MSTNSSKVPSSGWLQIFPDRKGSYPFNNPAAVIDSADVNCSLNRNHENHTIEESENSGNINRENSQSYNRRNPSILSSPHEKIPVNNVGLFSYLFVSWMTPLILKLFKEREKGIREEDLWKCSDSESVATNTEKLEVIWKKEIQSYGEKNSSFLRVWLKFTQTRFIILIVVFCFNTILTFLMTGYMTDLIVSYLESDESNLFYAVGLLVSNCVGQIFRAFSFGFLFFYGGQTGIRFRAGVLGLAYKKLIKLKSVKGDTSSEIITILVADTLRVFLNCQRFFVIVGFPVYLLIGAAYTYYLIGPWCFLAIGIYIVAYQFQAMLTVATTNFRRKAVVWTDKRIRLTKEVLNSMKMIKMYAWEEPFKESIKRARNKEVKYLRILSIISFISSGILPVTPTLSSVVTLAVYAAFGNRLKASTAFSVVSTTNFMLVIVALLPPAAKMFGETRVSFERIKRLLIKEEYQAPSRNVADESNAVEIKEGRFYWDNDGFAHNQINGDKNKPSPDNGPEKNTSSIQLKVTDVAIQKGTLIGICGAVGCGKSSLASAILGRMPILSGHLAVDGSVAYVSQQAWIFNGTLKENVVFGSTFDHVWYKEVICACGLLSDIKILPNGDETEIGDRGINISGGQKQRVSLARAVYSKCDIYLLDDPLSAVDVHVGQHLIHECINKLLKTKTVILVTHQLQYLEYCDEIIVMKDGEIVEQGTHDNLLKKGRKYTALMEKFNSTVKYSDTLDDEEADKGLLKLCQGPINEKLNSKDHGAKIKKTEGKGNLTEQEKVETGSISLNACKSYINAAGGCCLSIAVFMQYLLVNGIVIFSEWWLGIWIQQASSDTSTVADEQENISMSTSYSSWGNVSRYIKTTATYEFESDGGVDFHVIIYIASVGAIILSTVLKAFVSGTITLRASERLHNRALARVLKAPMSYSDANPPGRILNRFSRDTEEVDVYVPIFLDLVLMVLISVMMALASAAITLPWFLIALVPALLIFFVIKKVSTVSILQLKRFENVARSPLLSHITTTAHGLSTIVSYKQEPTFINKCMEYADMTSVGLFLFDGSIRWASLRLDLLASLLALCSAVVVVFTKDIISPALAALALSLCIKVVAIMQYLIRLTNELESRITSVERLHEYEGIEVEKETLSVEPAENWPSNGGVTFSDVTMRYRNDMDPVLRNIDFDIMPKQKVGIVGRTGAGKSSLAAALFRLSEVSLGQICIDGIDIRLIPRQLLRSKVSVIPQDPVLFVGTLRYNLDPFGNHSDSNLWSALEKVHIKEKIQQFDMNLDLRIEENGENFSVGERQLICLARAILRKNRVLVLDEATASVDTTTDAMIQHTIRDNFADCTVLTIAHRLNTVLHSDVIFVMESGRIIETGEPQDLLSNPSSHFNKMIRSQTQKPSDV